LQVKEFVTDVTDVTDVNDNNQGDKAMTNITANDKHSVFRDLAKAGTLNARNLFPHAETLAAVMNKRAARSSRFTDDHAVSPKQVLQALQKPALVYSKGPLGIRIICHRITQALSEECGLDISPRALWGGGSQSPLTLT
jgi:hypothetical protein